jgi:hypothetical protein
MTRRKMWNGIGVWSSHPCPSPVALNLQHFHEMVVLMSWDERLAKAMRRAHREYVAAGSPGIPLGSTNYRKKHKVKTK